jgi:hypothetical protein
MTASSGRASALNTFLTEGDIRLRFPSCGEMLKRPGRQRQTGAIYMYRLTKCLSKARVNGGPFARLCLIT